MPVERAGDDGESVQESKARDFQVGDRVRVVLNAEVVAISTDREWLLLSPGRIWIPIDEFVERIMIRKDVQA